MIQSSKTFRVAILLILIGLLIGLTYVNYEFSRKAPGGNDFLARWTGAHYWLVEGVNPYDQQVSLAAQKMIYGRPANPAAGEDIAHFVYPLPAMIFFAPFGLLPYTAARAVWMTLLEISLPILAVIGLRIGRWKPGVATMAAVLLFSVVWYHGVRSVIVGQFAVIEALLLCGGLLAVQQKNDLLAGWLFGFAIAKPQMAFLLIPLVIFWAVSRRRWTLVGWTIGSILILLAGTLIIMPDWPLRWLQQLVDYPRYTELGSPISILVGWLPQGGGNLATGVSILLLIYMVYEWIVCAGKPEHWFQWTAAMTLVITNLVAFRTATTNYVVLLPGLLFVFSALESRWGRTGVLAAWGLMIALLIGLWLLFLVTVQGNVENAAMYIPLPVLVWAGLLWTRWWVVRGPRLSLGESAV